MLLLAHRVALDLRKPRAERKLDDLGEIGAIVGPEFAETVIFECTALQQAILSFATALPSDDARRLPAPRVWFEQKTKRLRGAVRKVGGGRIAFLFTMESAEAALMHVVTAAPFRARGPLRFPLKGAGPWTRPLLTLPPELPGDVAAVILPLFELVNSGVALQRQHAGRAGLPSWLELSPPRAN